MKIGRRSFLQLASLSTLALGGCSIPKIREETHHREQFLFDIASDNAGEINIRNLPGREKETYSVFAVKENGEKYFVVDCLEGPYAGTSFAQGGWGGRFDNLPEWISENGIKREINNVQISKYAEIMGRITDKLDRKELTFSPERRI